MRIEDGRRRSSKERIGIGGGLRRPFVCPSHTPGGAGKEDEGEGGDEQPGPEHQVQDCREIRSFIRTEVEKIQPMGRGKMWPT